MIKSTSINHNKDKKEAATTSVFPLDVFKQKKQSNILTFFGKNKVPPSNLNNEDKDLQHITKSLNC